MDPGSLRLPHGFLLVGLAGGCSSSNAPAPSCPGVTSQAIVNGTAHESYLGLTRAQTAAIVQIVPTLVATGSFCTGVFVATNWVVTARHCLQILSPKVIVQGDAQFAPISLQVMASLGHPTEDVALLKVDTSSLDAGIGDGGIIDVSPIEIAGAAASSLTGGDSVEIAGYGFTETGITGSLRFVVELIRDINTTSIRVSGFGASGACEGDSGGPLLIRGRNGLVAVAGIESFGSASCLNEDTFVRLDAIQPWFEATIGAWAVTDTTCGGITEQGRCLYGRAIWCNANVLTADVCSQGTRCGWDSNQLGFRCVATAGDPCDGVDAIGACVGPAALRCNAGVLARQLCGPCNACRIDGTTGIPNCTHKSPLTDAAL